MNNEIIITDIVRVIYVAAQEYPEKATDFGTTVPCQELIYNISLDNTVYFGDDVLHETPNSIRYLPEGETSRYIVERNQYGDCIDIFFTANCNLSECAFVKNLSNNKRVEELFKTAFSAWVRQDSRSRFEAMSILYKIFSELQRDPSIRDSKYQILKPAVAFINENFFRKIISNTELAELCGISPTYLKKLFVECYKIHPRQYIIKMKINYAADLLKANSRSVAEIADMAGFCDTFYFSRVFKQETGLTPTAYQKKYISSK